MGRRKVNMSYTNLVTQGGFKLKMQMREGGSYSHITKFCMSTDEIETVRAEYRRQEKMGNIKFYGGRVELNGQVLYEFNKL